jgi:hypothetical protein
MLSYVPAGFDTTGACAAATLELTGQLAPAGLRRINSTCYPDDGHPDHDFEDDIDKSMIRLLESTSTNQGSRTEEAQESLHSCFKGTARAKHLGANCMSARFV